MWGEIIGGWEAGRHSRPYMAFVKIETGGDRKGGCRGFLMWEDVVVTTAPCNCKLGTITVLLGAHNVEIGELGRQEVWVHHRILHPEFNDETDEKDLMLLQGGGTEDHGQGRVSSSTISALCPVQDAVWGGSPEEEGIIPAQQ
ncbi:unnamed protein product, partial [Caretta caretta]